MAATAPIAASSGATDDLQYPAVVARYLTTGKSPIDPSHAELVYAIGHELYAREDFRRALDLFRLLALCAPNDARSWFVLGACHDALGEDERAAALYLVAVAAPEGRTHRLRATAYLARLLLAEGRKHEALDRVEELNEALEGNDDPWFSDQVEALRREATEGRAR